MRTGSDDLNEALEKGQRTYDIHASLGGQDLSDEVSEWAVERNIDTGVPEEVGIPTGAAAAAVDLTLVGGKEFSAASRYSPWAPRSSADITRPGQSMVFEWGLAEERLSSVRGRTSSIDVHSLNGTAQVEALDGSELLRGSAWLPPFWETLNWQAHTQWVVDHALRMSGIYCSPPPRDGCVFFASMNGGLTANYGMLRSSSQALGFFRDISPWTAGPSRHLNGEPNRNEWQASYTPQRRLHSQSRRVLVEWWVRCTGDDEGPRSEVRLKYAGGASNEDPDTTTVRMWFDPEEGKIGTAVAGIGRTWSLDSGTIKEGNYKIVFIAYFESTSQDVIITPRLLSPENGIDETFPETGSNPPVWGFMESIDIRAEGPIECVGVTPVSTNPTAFTIWKKGADIGLIGDYVLQEPDGDYGLYYLPEVSGTWWDMLKEIAEATHSYIWFDEDGYFRMRAFEYMEPGQSPPPDLTVTSARDIADIDVSEDIRGVANQVSVGHTSIGPGANTTQKHLSRVITLGAYETFALAVNFQNHPWSLVPPMNMRGSSTPSTSDGSVIKFLTEDSNELAPVETELRFDTGMPVYYFHNLTSTNARAILSPDEPGESSFYVVYDDPTVEDATSATVTDSDSVARYGKQTLDIGASPWVQSMPWARALAENLAGWTAWPLPKSSDVQILPDPRIQVGDVARVEDLSGTHIEGNYRVMGYSVKGSGSSVTMTLDLRPLSRPDRPEDAGLDREPVLTPDAPDQIG